MKLRMTVTLEYETGADDAETLNGYRTLDPEGCAQVDRENVENLGVIDFISFLESDHVVSWKIEPVT